MPCITRKHPNIDVYMIVGYRTTLPKLYTPADQRFTSKFAVTYTYYFNLVNYHLHRQHYHLQQGLIQKWFVPGPKQIVSRSSDEVQTMRQVI